MTDRSPAPPPTTADDTGDAGGDERERVVPEHVTITLDGRREEIEYHPVDTILETARRGGFDPPFSCQAGNCGTCMAMLREGMVSMRANDVLTPEELEEGWILTCQSEPTSTEVVVDYDV